MEDRMFWSMVRSGVNEPQKVGFALGSLDYDELIPEIEDYCQEYNLPPEHILRKSLARLNPESDSKKLRKMMSKTVFHWFVIEKELRIQNSKRVSQQLLDEQGLTPQLLKSFKIEPEDDGLYNLVKIQIRKHNDNYLGLALMREREGRYLEKYLEESRPEECCIEEENEEYARAKAEFVTAVDGSGKEEPVLMLRPRAAELVQEGKGEWKEETQTDYEHIVLKSIECLPEAQAVAHSAHVSNLYRVKKYKSGNWIAIFTSPITTVKWNALQSITKLSEGFCIQLPKDDSSTKFCYEWHRHILKSQPRSYEEYLKIYNIESMREAVYESYEDLEGFEEYLYDHTDYFKVFWL